MRITYMGTCANQTATREATGFLVDSRDGTFVLVDAGPGVVRQIYSAGVKPCQISDIVVTHSHADHCGGLAYTLWSSFYDRITGGSGPDRVTIHALEDNIDGLRQALEFHYHTAAWPFSINWNSVTADGSEFLNTGQMTWAAKSVTHAAPNFGLKITEADTSIAYSSDTTYCEGFVDFARGVQLLIHEGFATSRHADLARRTGHSTSTEAGRAATVAGAGSLHLVHCFPEELDNLNELLREARAEFAGDVLIPGDLDVFSIQ